MSRGVFIRYDQINWMECHLYNKIDGVIFILTLFLKVLSGPFTETFVFFQSYSQRDVINLSVLTSLQLMMWISFCLSRTPRGYQIDGTEYWLFQSDLSFQRLPVQIMDSYNRNIVATPGGLSSDNTSRSMPLSVRLARQARWVFGRAHQSTAIQANRCQLGTWMGSIQLANHFPVQGSRIKLYLFEVLRYLGGACC